MPAYVHRVPGRIRLKSPLFRADTRLVAELTEELAQIDAVQNHQFNRTTGSVVITHAQGKDASGQLDALLTRWQARLDAPPPPVAAPNDRPPADERPAMAEKLAAQVGPMILNLVIKGLIQYGTRKLLVRALPF